MARTHGTGEVDPASFAHCGAGVVFEPGSLVFHPETIDISDDVYIGHYAILKGYHKGSMTLGRGTWIGQHAFLHSAGGIEVGKRVGIGPGVRILTSTHTLDGRGPIMDNPLSFAPVILEDGCDIGAGAVILPGARVGTGAQVGAGAVVTGDVDAFCICAGVPARSIGSRSL